MNACEVAIVGAGIHGASAAYHLGRSGVEAILFERDTPAAGPTGRSSAVCRTVYTNQFLARAARESLEMFDNFADLTGGGDAGYHRTGMLYLHRPTESHDRLVALINELREVGTSVEIVDPDRLASEHPQIVSDGSAAVWEADAGHADPAGTTRALVDDAARHGVKICPHTMIVRIEPRPGGGAIVRDADGQVTECERALIATGPWTRPLLAQLGVQLPLTVERHIVATFAWGDVGPIPYVVGDVSGGYYLKPEGPAHYGLGSLVAEPEVDPDDFQEGVGVDESLDLAVPAIRRIPELSATSFVGGWGSVYDVSPDWQPVIGEIADRIYVSAGTSGHGFKLAPALGRHIAMMVRGGDYDRGLCQFEPGRFAAGETLDAGFGEVRILG